MQIRMAIQAINQRQYQQALNILQNIVSTQRNARWYYLSGVANNGAGNQMMAVDHMTKAVQMDPNNRTYHALLNQYRQAGQTYERNARGFNMGAMDPSRLCLGLCLARMFCGPYCWCC